MVSVDLLDDLDERQLAAVTNPTDPVCVLARAGTGKTRVLSRRIAWRAAQGTLDIRRVLAITFTTRAARELQTRLGDLLGRDTGTTGTFHAIAYRTLCDHHRDHRRPEPVLLERPRSLIAELLGPEHRGMLDAITAQIGWASARGLTPDAYVGTGQARPGTNTPDPQFVSKILGRYEREKRRRGVVDFDDLIGDCIELLENDEAFARAQRWRFRHFFVDEYQDVNPMQQRLLDAWRGDREDLFVVGDPNQAIYAFNGADAGYLTGFADRHPDATVIELVENHRSPPGIVKLADSVITPTTAIGHVEGVASVTGCDDENAEALQIARRLREEHTPGRRWSSQAVLVRTHAQAAPILEVLGRAGIPVTAPNDTRRTYVAHDDPGSNDSKPRDATRHDGTHTDAVLVVTFHSAKGLEWPVVHIAGVEEGFVPDIHARSPESLAEEQRLFYVATTRATRRVHLTWARHRSFGQRTIERSPSRWLRPIDGAIIRRTPRTPQSTPRPEPVTPGTTNTVRSRLVTWRADVARAAAVPPSVVMADSTLEHLVEATPDDIDALTKVPGLGPVKAARFGAAVLDAIHPGSNR